jgi:hypothetical protein
LPVNKQLSFAAGEVNPSIYGRADLQKFDSACRTLKNMIVHVEGGASNRAGLEYIGAVHDSTETTRLIRFRFNTAQTYILEFSDFFFRVIKDQAYVMSSAVSITAATKADPCVITVGAHSYVVGQELYIKDVAGMTELNGIFYRIKAVAATTISLEDIFGTGIDSSAFATYTSGGTIEVVPIFDTFFPQADLAKLKFTQNADTLTVVHPDHNGIYDITRTAHDVWTVTQVDFTSQTSAPSGMTATPSTANTGFVRNYVITAINDTTGEESVASSADNADHDLAADATRTNDLAWTDPGSVTWKVYCDDNASGVFGFIGNASTNAFEDNFITPNYDITPPQNKEPVYVFEDFVITGATQADPVVLTITAGARTPAVGDQVDVSGVAGMTELNGNTYFAKATSATTIDLEDKEGTSLDGTGFSAYSSGGVAQVSEQDKSPRCVTYHQQRRIFAGPDDTPSTFYTSRVGLFANMNVSAVTQADDAITFNVVADDVNEIRDMKSQKDLFLFTSSGIFRITTGESLVFSQTNISSEEQESWGVSDIEALKVGQSFLYVQDGERVVRDLQDSIEANGFTGDDLTLLAKHLFKERKIVEWAYARDPDSVIWCVMDDGTANALTYLRKHQIWAWTHHVTDGLFKSVAAIPETTSEYGVYFVVERTIEGTTGSASTMKYVERIKNRDVLDIKDSFFVDSGLSLDTALTVSGATAASPVVITATAHGFTDADFVDFDEVGGMVELNDNRYKIGNKTANTFELYSRSASVYSITAATKADPCEVTVGTHTHTEGQQIKISGVVGMTELNGNTYQVNTATATTITLKSIAGVTTDSSAFTTYVSGGTAEVDADVDGSAFTAYTSGGKVRKAVTTLSGLQHLEGESVSVLADGGTAHNPLDSDLTTKTVSGGAITLSNAASRVHIGLPYTSDLENIGVDLTSLNGFGDALARKKTIPTVKIRVQDSAGIRIGPDADNLEPYKPPGVDANEGQAFLNEVIEKTMLNVHDHDGTVFIRQIGPLPMTILSLLPEVQVQENE